MPQIPQNPAQLWLDPLPSGGRILLLGREGPGSFRNAVALARAQGARVQVEEISTREKDPRLLTLERERYHSIYWDSTPASESSLLPLEHVQRVLLTCFQGLLPREGILAFSSPADAWKSDAIESLLRQSGFVLLGTWSSEADQQELRVLRRV